MRVDLPATAPPAAAEDGRPLCLRRLLKADNLLTDHLSVLILLRGDPSPHKDLCLLIQKAAVFLVISGKHHNFYIAHQILQVQKGHNLILFRIFDGLVRNHSSHHHNGLIRRADGPRLLIQHKIVGGVGDVALPELLVFLQRVAA